MRVDIRTCLLVTLLGTGLLVAGCNKGGGEAGNAQSGGDMAAPGAKMTPEQIEQIRRQRMPPANAGRGGRPMMGGGNAPMMGGAPGGAPGAPTTR